MDVSNYAVSGIINQKGAKNKYKHLITFHNQKLNSVK